MADEANSFYNKQFTQEEKATDFTLLDNILDIISADTNDQLCKELEVDEIKIVVLC